MVHCLNPNCPQPTNDKTAKVCRSCRTPLVLRERYLAIKPIGRGGFGRTFLAIDVSQSDKPRCVIKQSLLQAQGIHDPDVAAGLFQKEAEQLKKLGRHPHIPYLLDHFEVDNSQYLIQEFIDGVNLNQELKESQIYDEQAVLRLLLSLLPTLKFIHDHQVIHRDIKPANIIRRQRDRTLFLVDLGAAKQATGTALALTGTVIGSAEYTAPEQARGKAIYASDIYSLGVTCLHLLTEISPFDLFDVGNAQWAWRDYLLQPISDDFAALIDKMIVPATNHRYQSIEEVQTDLLAILPQRVDQPKQISQTTDNSVYKTGFNSNTPDPSMAPVNALLGRKKSGPFQFKESEPQQISDLIQIVKGANTFEKDRFDFLKRRQELDVNPRPKTPNLPLPKRRLDFRNIFSVGSARIIYLLLLGILMITPLFIRQGFRNIGRPGSINYNLETEEASSIILGTLDIDSDWQPLEIVAVEAIENINFFDRDTRLPIVRNTRETAPEGQTWFRARVVFDVESSNPPLVVSKVEGYQIPAVGDIADQLPLLGDPDLAYQRLFAINQDTTFAEGSIHFAPFNVALNKRGDFAILHYGELSGYMAAFQIWDVRLGELKFSFESTNHYGPFFINNLNRIGYYAPFDNQVRIYDFTTEKLIHTFDSAAENSTPLPLATSPDEKFLITIDGYNFGEYSDNIFARQHFKNIRVWNLETGKIEKQYRHFRSGFDPMSFEGFSVEFSADGKTAIVQSGWKRQKIYLPN